LAVFAERSVEMYVLQVFDKNVNISVNYYETTIMRLIGHGFVKNKIFQKRSAEKRLHVATKNKTQNVWETFLKQLFLFYE